ncbi:MAG TPA: hypothetical protein VIM07_03400 [Chitinophagaceae bacterium]
MEFDLIKSTEALERTPKILEELRDEWSSHIAQITRVMAKQYKEAIGQWIKYFRVMQ